MTAGARSLSTRGAERTGVVVVGAGGHGRELLDTIEACALEPGSTLELLGVLDDGPSELNLARLRSRGVKFLGALEEALPGLPDGTRYVIGIGDAHARRAVSERMSAVGLEPATVVHPAAVLGADVELAPGVVVLAGAVLANNIQLGRHTHVHRLATVGHDCTLGEFVTVNPSASISGDCAIGDDVLVGVGAAVLQGIRVLGGSVIGGMACVVRDVPAHSTVKGVPAK